MTRFSENLLEIDVEKLFEERSIEEIIEIEKLLDAEIERKRNELRSTVGDRYKDVLAASDAIKSMQQISETIMENIDTIATNCETVLNQPFQNRKAKILLNDENQERILVGQIHLSIVLNERMWNCLEIGDNLEAAQLFLLAQHIQTGLSLTKQEILKRIPLIEQINLNLRMIQKKIYKNISERLESSCIEAEEVAKNLNALLLMQNHKFEDLIGVFIKHRKAALNIVVTSEYSNVRLQISAMVQCLITTIALIHDCFLCNEVYPEGIIIKQINEITNENAPSTLSKTKLPINAFISYIPEVIMEFKPKCEIDKNSLKTSFNDLIKDWLKETEIDVQNGLNKNLELIPNVKGLHIIREEAFKVPTPKNWLKICQDSLFSENFTVWAQFFQHLITKRAEKLISSKLSSLLNKLKEEIECCIGKSTFEPLPLWNEQEDFKTKNENHLKLLTKGYSQEVVDLGQKFEEKYFELLEDCKLYLCGSEDMKKNVDKDHLESHLLNKTKQLCCELADFVEGLFKGQELNEEIVGKSLICARFLQAVPELCSNFNNSFVKTSHWKPVEHRFNETSLQLWKNWLNYSIKKTKEFDINDISVQSLLKTLQKWDVIEIQEEAEQKVFKSYIRVPLKPSISLHLILTKLTKDLNKVLPHTVPKEIHTQFIANNVCVIFAKYEELAKKDLNQTQLLQYLFDVKFVTTFCVLRQNVEAMEQSQAICDLFRGKIDPFDLDVFYSYLQENVKKSVGQSQAIFGYLLPSSSQLASLGVCTKVKEQEKEPCVLARSTPTINSSFPLLPITIPSQKINPPQKLAPKDKAVKKSPKRSNDPTGMVRSGAASLFGGLTSDWFS